MIAPARQILILIATERVSGPLKGIFQYLRHRDVDRWRPLLGFVRSRRSTASDAEMEATREGIPFVVLEQSGSFDWRLIREVRRIAVQYGASLVQSHGYKTHVLGFFLRWFSGLPWLGFEHGWTAENWRVRLYQNAAFLLRYADRVVAVSDPLRASIARLGVPAGKIETMPNAVESISSEGVPRGTFRRAHGIPLEAPLVGVVGRFSLEKGQRVFLEAFKLLSRDCPTAQAVLVGEGLDESYLRARAETLGLNVHFPGHQRAMSCVYQDLDTVAIPSLSEGIPNVLLEAMASGRPVVATAVGGIPSVATHGVHALLVPAEAPEELAGAMTTLLHDRELRERLVTQARDRVRTCYSAEARARRIFDLYDTLVG
jgi:glycosyltransferase involved in cell wall biosynthesis